MKNNNSFSNEVNQVQIEAPKPFLDRLLENQIKILSLLESNSKNAINQGIGEFVSEEEAQKILGKKTTWFWQMRKDGLLPFSKLGSSNYYSKADLEKLIQSNLIGPSEFVFTNNAKIKSKK